MESMLETTLTHAADKPIQQQLVEEQARATKLGVLIAALEQLAEDGPKLSEASLAPFQVTLNQLLYQEFVHLPAAKKGAGPSMTVLDIDNTPSPHQFTYTDKQTIRTGTVELATRRILQPAIEFVREKRRQPATFNVFGIERTQQELLDSERKRQRLQADLMAAHERRLALLQRAVEQRVGGQQGDAMEVLLKRLTLYDVKIGVLKGMIEREFAYRTDHSAKALKEVEGYIDVALETYKK